MTLTETELTGLLVIEPRVFDDSRGCFFESWNRARFDAAGLPSEFVQDNVSCSTRGVLRGLHYQQPNSQGKLVSVLAGEVYDVAVDIRRGSVTFGRWFGCVLSEHNRRQLYVPPGFAHGFLVLSDSAVFTYKCTEYYAADCEHTLAWDDPDVRIDWPIQPVVVSDKDRAGRRLSEIAEPELPVFEPCG